MLTSVFLMTFIQCPFSRWLLHEPAYLCTVTDSSYATDFFERSDTPMKAPIAQDAA